MTVKKTVKPENVGERADESKETKLGNKSGETQSEMCDL